MNWALPKYTNTLFYTPLLTPLTNIHFLIYAFSFSV